MNKNLPYVDGVDFGVGRMKAGLLGRKIGMTQIFEADGTAVPVTVLECGPCTILQLKTDESDGYSALQIGFADKRRKSASAAERGHAKKAEAEPKKFVREIRQNSAADLDGLAVGGILTVEVFNSITKVDVIGTSKGRGFAGVIKRHGFKGLRASHGVKRMHRHPGSSGPSADPSRTFPGVRKPGHYGVARVTSKNLKVVKIDAESNLLLVRGAVAGPNGGFVMVRQSVKS
jgi:large subunit ribosomal protein L3